MCRWVNSRTDCADASSFSAANAFSSTAAGSNAAAAATARSNTIPTADRRNAADSIIIGNAFSGDGRSAQKPAVYATTTTTTAGISKEYPGANRKCSFIAASSFVGR